MGVNEIKTKCMGFGDTKPFKVYFNGCHINHVVKYKYLGNIIRSTRQVKDDAFGENYKYLCDQARKALFGMYKKLKNWKNPPRDNALHLWCNDQTNPGIRQRCVGNKATHLAVDKDFLHFAMCILCVKATTGNTIVLVKLVTCPQSCRAWYQH